MKRELGRFLIGIKRFLREMHPSKWVLIGYASYIVIGWFLLCLPFSQKGPGASELDHLFTAASAVSTTGLTTISLSDNYTFFGQLIILSLIQLGGIGYMTLGSFVILASRRELSRERTEISRTVFSLPESFHLAHFIRGVVLFTLFIEAAGAVLLFIILQSAGQPNVLWSAVFHSVSAFCTAGFSLYNTSFEGFADNFWLNAVIAALSFFGAIGFIVFMDYWNMATGRVKSITLTSKIILWMTFWMVCAGTLLLFLGEPSLQSRPPDERILASFFQAMTSMTTVGFNTVGVSGLSKASILLLIIFMVIGSSPSGTGGGIKSTTVSALVGVMRSAVRGEREVRFWNRPIPLERVWTAVGSVGFYLSTLIVGTYLLEMTETSSFDQNFFEAASALGTVGLSMGITASLSVIGKIIVILLMFFGRLGPLTFGIALFGGGREVSEKGENDLAV